jgi:Flp pilus assembly pilin Flp
MAQDPNQGLALTKRMTRGRAIFQSVAFRLRPYDRWRNLMLKQVMNFARKEDGAVTIDWVVLTAAVVALAGVAITSLQTASGGLGDSVGSHLTSTQVGR